MEPPTLTPSSSPSKGAGPLYPVSPDRINQQRLPQSASFQDLLLSPKHHRNSSDVQSKVAFLNSLNNRASINTSPQQNGNATTAALQRAIIGREEAESTLRSLRDEMAEAQIRERKISERLESLMEELQSTKERQAYERQVYEKEIKRSRKDAFRAGSSLVKVQEDLKEARTEVRSLKSTVQKERSEKEQAKQEAFERAYTLAGLTEETQALKEQLKSFEAAKEAELPDQDAEDSQIEQKQPPAHTDEEDVAVESKDDQEVGMRFLLTSHGMKGAALEGPKRRHISERPPLTYAMLDNLKFAEPTIVGRRRESFHKTTFDDEGLHIEDRMEDLYAEYLFEKKMRAEAEDLVEFMHMECQFMTCACRTAEKRGQRFIHDWEWENKIRAESVERKDKTDTENRTDRDDEDPSRMPENIMESVDIDSEHRHVELGTDQPEANDRSYTPDELPRTGVENETQADEPASADDAHNDGKMQAEPPQDLFDISHPMPQEHHTSNNISPPREASPQPRVVTPNHESISHEQTPPTTDFSATEEPLTFLTPARPLIRSINEETTTITVPLRDQDAFSPMPGTPGTPAMIPGTPVSREQALAQIRARRDRARSMSRQKETRSAPGSARRAAGGRDISAPGGF